VSPVPLKLITAVALVDELLVTVSCPVTDPVTVGSNCRLSVTDWPGFNVTGKLDPDTEKLVPAIVAELTVTAADPVELNVTDCVVGVLITTLPNDTLVALMLNVGVAALSCSAKLCEPLPSVAVNVAVWAVLTKETVAVKLALLAPTGTVADAGTMTERLLLAKATLTPPLGAAPLSVTVQASVPDPVIDELVQERALNPGMLTVPVPLRLTTAEGLLDEVLLMVS
jgi:hypothetical protein